MKNSKFVATAVALVIAIGGAFASNLFVSQGYAKINGTVVGPQNVDGGFDCTGSSITCTITVNGVRANAYDTSEHANAQGSTGLLKRN